MYIEEKTSKTRHVRRSKHGKEHTYFRYKHIVILRCDSCNELFQRERGSMDPKRLTNNYFHVCSNCDTKRFAQKKGIEKKQIWNLPASSDLDISKL